MSLDRNRCRARVPRERFVIDSESDVHRVEVEGREFILVGTAHVSRESTALVRAVIERERPDTVCVELDRQRYEALSQKRSWEALDLRQIIRKQQLAALLANLVLASYQKKLGSALGVQPGAELIEATRVADELGIRVDLCDRDVRITLRRAWASTSLWKKAMLLATLLTSIFDRPEISEEELRKLREQDVLSELMRELGEAMPGLKRVLIDERDVFLTQKMKEAPGRRILAVIGAGHVAGIRRALVAPGSADLEEINRIPPMRPVLKWVGWGVPGLILGALVVIGLRRGVDVAGENLLIWIVANGVPSTLGALIALAHPATVISAFFVAPVTSLIPVIGAGYVLAFLQAYLAPPLVSEFESVTDDVTSPRRWWSNRLLRIMLVFVFTTLGSLIGTYVGGYAIVSNLF